MIVGFDHTSFTVSDVMRSARFWTEALGFAITQIVDRDGVWPGRVTGVSGAKLRVVHLSGYGQHIELIQYLGNYTDNRPLQPNISGAAHIALQAKNIRETCEMLLKHGATFQGELTDVVISGIFYGQAIYLRDPSGILIELWEPDDDIECNCKK